MGRFETQWLAADANLSALGDLSGLWIDRVHRRKPPKLVILDMDSSVNPTHGDQEGTAYNGHFGCTCYHPLFLFNQLGDLERCALRPGNVPSAEGWRGVLDPVVERYRGRKLRRYFRGDAAFASPDIYEYLETEGFGHAIRLPGNSVLQGYIAHLLRRPRGAATDGSPSLLRQLSLPGRNLGQGTAEQHTKEGKNAIRWTRLSCRTFKANAVRLQLHALAYNLGNFMRTLALPQGFGAPNPRAWLPEGKPWPDPVSHWSLTTLREKLMKIGAKVALHGRYVTFQLAEVAVPRALFADILDRIDRLRPRPVPT